MSLIQILFNLQMLNGFFLTILVHSTFTNLQFPLSHTQQKKPESPRIYLEHVILILLIQKINAEGS